jgi:Tfp pilus assembly protein PilE
MQLNTQRGSIMVEVLLASAVMAVITGGVLQVVSAYQADTRAKGVGEQMLAVQKIASEYYLANAGGMRAAMADGTGAAQLCRLGVNPAAANPATTGLQSNESVTKHTCAIDLAFLKWKGVIPDSFKETNSYRQKLVAIFKLVYKAGVATDDVEMLIVGAGGASGITGYAPGAYAETDITKLYTAAEIIGWNGGVIPDKDRVTCKWTASVKQACGMGGGWTADLTKFVN